MRRGKQEGIGRKEDRGWDRDEGRGKWREGGEEKVESRESRGRRGE